MSYSTFKQRLFFLGFCLFLIVLNPYYWVKAQDESSFKKQTALFSQQCSKCHTVGKGDRVGPDLKDISSKRERSWLINFIQKPSKYLSSDPIAIELLKKYNNVQMPDLDINHEQAELLLDYIETLSTTTTPTTTGGRTDTLPEREVKVVYPDEGKGVATHWLALTVLLGIAAVVFFFYSKRATAATLAVLTLFFAYWSFGGRHHHQYIGLQQGYEPTQPISYSHKLHAGELKISCLYCHHGAEKSPVAGVPSVNVCMNCHQILEKSSPDLQKLNEIWESRNTESPKSIEWVQVHRLPDFVYFNHQAHVQNNISCQECHGPVETMDTIRQVSDLSMGFCVNCHRHEGQPAPTHWKREKGPLDCTACHQ